MCTFESCHCFCKRCLPLRGHCNVTLQLPPNLYHNLYHALLSRSWLDELLLRLNIAPAIYHNVKGTARWTLRGEAQAPSVTTYHLPLTFGSQILDLLVLQYWHQGGHSIDTHTHTPFSCAWWLKKGCRLELGFDSNFKNRLDSDF